MLEAAKPARSEIIEISDDKVPTFCEELDQVKKKYYFLLLYKYTK